MAHLKYHNYVSESARDNYKMCAELLEDACIILGCVERKDEVITKLLDSSVTDKIKPKKDPNKPKRPNTNYLIFSNEIRESISKANPEAKMGEISKIISEKWKGLSDDDRQKYSDKASKDKDRYEEQMEEYNNNLHIGSVMQYVNDDEIEVNSKSKKKKEKSKDDKTKGENKKNKSKDKKKKKDDENASSDNE